MWHSELFQSITKEKNAKAAEKTGVPGEKTAVGDSRQSFETNNFPRG